MAHILVFGDSITWGANDSKGGWVQRLRRYLETLGGEEEFRIYNVGISGDNTEGLLERFESEAKPRLDDEEKNIIIFAIGINDSQFLQAEQKNTVDENKFRENIKLLIEQASRISDITFFLGLTPVDENKTTPISWRPNKNYFNSYIKSYNEIIREVCEEKNIPFVDLFKENFTRKLSDGLHPNEEGHELIFQAVNAKLTELIKIP